MNWDGHAIDLYSSANIITVLRPRTARREGNVLVASTVKLRYVYKIWLQLVNGKYDFEGRCIGTSLILNYTCVLVQVVQNRGLRRNVVPRVTGRRVPQ
jgi:hypothetical protein